MTQSFLTTSLDALKRKAAELETILRDREGIAVEHETDPLDEAIGAATRDVAVQSIEMARKQLRLVYAALKRIAVGTYGFCETCGNPISDKRLTAVPWAAECLECAMRREGREERPGPMARSANRMDRDLLSPSRQKLRSAQNLRSTCSLGARY